MPAPLRAHVPRALATAMMAPLLLALAGCSTAVPAAPLSGGAGAASTSSGPTTGTSTGAALGAPAEAPAIATGAPATPGVTGPTAGSSGAGTATAGAGIAYPYPVYPGSSGLAPEHTIVVTGIGQAPVKADLSDRATAQRSALAAALADAKAQADVVARGTGLTITGVLSVSVSSGQDYAVPMAGAAEGSSSGAAPGGTTTTPPEPAPTSPSVSQLAVSVTVAYQVG